MTLGILRLCCRRSAGLNVSAVVRRTKHSIRLFSSGKQFYTTTTSYVCKLSAKPTRQHTESKANSASSSGIPYGELHIGVPKELWANERRYESISNSHSASDKLISLHK